jgi:hypothetical protein
VKTDIKALEGKRGLATGTEAPRGGMPGETMVTADATPAVTGTCSTTEEDLAVMTDVTGVTPVARPAKTLRTELATTMT